MMTQEVSFDLLCVSLAILLLVLIVLLLLCWILRSSRNRDFTELKVSAGQPAHVLTIRTKQDHSHQLLDHLLDRIFLQVEPGSESGVEPEEEPEGELKGDCGSDSGSDPGVSTADSFPSRAVKTLQNALGKWIVVSNPPPATPAPSPPRSPPAAQDQTKDLCSQSSDVSQYDSPSTEGASCSAYWKENEQHDESQL